MIVFTVPCEDKTGEHQYTAELVWEIGRNYSLTPQKIADIWREARKFDVLFSDETEGKFEPFFFSLVNPAAVWFEIRREGEKESIGLAYFTSIIPGFDAQGHFTFWDHVAAGREAILLFLAEWIMDRYQLHRISGQVPPYQAGVMRFLRRLGFVQEGEMREAVRRKGKRFPLILYGMTRSDLDSKFQTLY